MHTPALLALLGLVSPFATAQSRDVPLTNWTVSPYRGTASAEGGLSTMTDVTPGIGFVGVAPCRLVDTRQAGFPAGYGTPSLTAGVPRNFDLNSDPLCTGIPAGVDAYSLNITATNTQGPGFILIYPQDSAQPPVSTLNYLANETVANAAIVPAGTNGGVTVIAGVSGAHLIIDINGYFTDQYNPGVSFHAIASNAAPAILGENMSSAANAVAIQGVIAGPGGSSSAAIRGINQGTGYGVMGETAASFGGSAGVLGVGRGGRVAVGAGYPYAPGLRGESRSGTAVQGLTEPSLTEGEPTYSVKGDIIPVGGGGNPVARGVVGYSFSGLNYGVYSDGDAHVNGTFTAVAKNFVEPHPHDASKEIRYVSLEGPHAEVYFRGTSQISRGITRIAIPEDFRFVADPGTYSTLVTPVGGMATVAVLSEGEAGVVVQASRDVKIHYVVYAERAALKNPEPIVDNVHFRPEDERNAFAHIPDSYRRLLIQNGTLNPDGTVNMETARRLGWDKQWEKRERPSPQPTPE